jgi:large subunit ribosomal protein L21
MPIRVWKLQPTKMMSRTIRRSILDIRIHASSLPPIFLLPNQCRYFNSTTQIVEPPSESSKSPPAFEVVAASPSDLPQKSPSASAPSQPEQEKAPKPLSDSVKKLLPLLIAQRFHFITAHIHARPYLVTPGDIVRLPFRMPGVVPGDVLRLNRASIIGSRDYTLKGAPYLDERIFKCRAMVLGTEGEPVRVKEKTKRRNRKVKTVRSKHKFTMLRISELRIKSLEEIEG